MDKGVLTLDGWVSEALARQGYWVEKRFAPSGRFLGYLVKGTNGAEFCFTTINEVRSFARSPGEWLRCREAKLARARKARQVKTQ